MSVSCWVGGSFVSVLCRLVVTVVCFVSAFGLLFVRLFGSVTMCRCLVVCLCICFLCYRSSVRERVISCRKVLSLLRFVS